MREPLEKNLDQAEWELRIDQRTNQLRAGTRRSVPASDVDHLLGVTDVPDAEALDWIE